MDQQLSLERLLRCERCIRQVYLDLSDRVDLADEVRFFCRCMAEDERKDILVLEKSSTLRTTSMLPSVPEKDFIEVEDSVVTAEALAAQVVLTVDDVLRLALRIEGSTLKRLDQMWIAHFDSTFGRLLQDIAPEPEIRVRRLIEAIHMFSSDPSLRDEVASLWAAH